MSPAQAPGRGLPASSSSGGSRHPLAGGCVPPISASVSLWLFLWVCIPIPSDKDRSSNGAGALFRTPLTLIISAKRPVPHTATPHRRQGPIQPRRPVTTRRLRRLMGSSVSTPASPQPVTLVAGFARRSRELPPYKRQQEARTDSGKRMFLQSWLRQTFWPPSHASKTLKRR